MDSLYYIEKIRKFNRYYANVLGQIDQVIYNQPYPLTEARVITEINASDGCTATEVREKLGIDRGYMSRIIQKFEEEKIIDKKVSPCDKRQQFLYLTDKGKKILHRLVDDANREVSKMVQPITQRDLTSMVSAMEQIEAILTQDYAKQPAVFIRSFQPGDLGFIAHLHGILYSETYRFGQDFEYYVMKGLTEFMGNPDGGELWVAEVNGEIAGSIAITKSSSEFAKLRWYVIDENYQGLGIGKKLMETAIDFCKKQNYQHIFLWTVNILDAARHLYQKYGFERTEEKTNNAWTSTTLIEERWDLNLIEEKS